MREQTIENQVEILRAIAVILVLLFHAGTPYFSNGYLGVDIFFVISGYLMTSHIFKSLESNKFSFVEFYEKRIRRIIPALLLVSFITIPPAFIILLPDHLENYGQSLVASTLFANNILLYLTANYWDTRSELKPLLHTWSLGVEIQFYIIYPILLYIARRKLAVGKFSIVFILFSLALVLFILRQTFSNQAIFYLLPFRLYEFMMGGVISVVQKKRGGQNFIYNAIGYVLIAAGIFTPELFSNANNEDLYLLGAVLIGVCFIIINNPSANNKSNWIGSILIKIGGVSYSAYLIHQPVFAFIRASSPAHTSYRILLATVPVILLLSFISVKYVEAPFRSKAIVPSKTFYMIVLSASICLASFGMFLHITKGAPSRFEFGGNLRSFNESISYNERVRGYTSFEYAPNEQGRILVVGDSFARDFANVLIDGGGIKRSSIIYSSMNLDVCENMPKLIELISKHRINSLYISYQKFTLHCIDLLIDSTASLNLENTLIIGPKSFGGNINFLSLIPKEAWSLQSVEISSEALHYDALLRKRSKEYNYISLIDITTTSGRSTRVADKNGDLITLDGEHLTKPGALYIGCLLDKYNYSKLIHPNFKSQVESCI